jgi:hypothetical protein
MTSVKTRKLDISTILAVVKAQNSSGAIEPVTSGNALLTEQTNFGVASTITFPATANVRVSRNINTIKYNTLGIIVSAPNFTIPGSGTFKIVVSANFVANWNGVDTNNNWGNLASRVYLRNESDNLDEVLIGETCVGATQEYQTNNSFGKPLQQGVATLTGFFTQTSTKTYSIQQITNTQFSFGSVQPGKTGGSPSSTAITNPEVYVTVDIQKVA